MHPIPQTKKLFLCTTLLLCMILSCSGCTSNASPVTKTGFYFDTVITVTLYDDNRSSLLDDCFSMAETYEQLFSATVKDSDISKINRAEGRRVTVSDETVALLEKALEYCELSGGKFDITIGKLSSLWNFSENDGTLPDPSALSSALSTVDYRNVIISGNRVQLKNPDAAIDMGGIAKGYIADRMKEYLNKNGVSEGTINLGGNVLCLGKKKDGSPYRIGIQKPFDTQGTAAAVVEVQNETVVSSGVYERFVTIDNTLYHHILNPATGYPYENDLLGVTVVCNNSADGDALSTVCFSLGLNEGMKLIEDLPDTEAVFITKDHQLHCSDGIGTVIPFTEMTD